MDSIKKNTVAATIAIEMIQNEMATASFGLRKPFKSVAAGAAAKVVADKDAMFCARHATDSTDEAFNGGLSTTADKERSRLEPKWLRTPFLRIFWICSAYKIVV